jgi:hypothetical protein
MGIGDATRAKYLALALETMCERKHQRLLTGAEFAKRVVGHFLVAVGALSVALGTGIAGYHFIAGLGWIDSLLNASMILGGMGPVTPHIRYCENLRVCLYLVCGALLCGDGWCATWAISSPAHAPLPC